MIFLRYKTNENIVYFKSFKGNRKQMKILHILIFFKRQSRKQMKVTYFDILQEKDWKQMEIYYILIFLKGNVGKHGNITYFDIFQMICEKTWKYHRFWYISNEKILAYFLNVLMKCKKTNGNNEYLIFLKWNVRKQTEILSVFKFFIWMLENK